MIRILVVVLVALITTPAFAECDVPLLCTVAGVETSPATDYREDTDPVEPPADFWAAWTPVPNGAGMYINNEGVEEFVPLSPEAEAWFAEEQAMYEQQQAASAEVQAYLDERDAQEAESAIGLGMLDEMTGD